jgi:putative radical SAM enzyme (TIGR03279 family)
MSELIMAKNQGLVVREVVRDSPAFRAGMQPRDVIRKVDGHPVNDILDFRFHTGNEEFDVEFVRDGVYESARFRRGYGEELGIEFTFELADQIHTCDNKCVFCFIHQMPKGMRKSLYLMDDDFRLSFLHGNYVTLTNMSDEEFARTKEQGLSPLYVSVHATDERLRAFMLGHPGAQPILPRLRELIQSGISVHCQIVLCPGLNDASALDNTITDLVDLHSVKTGLRAGVLSVAVVPVGLSKFRHNLYPIKPVTGEYARTLFKQLAPWHKSLKQELGTRFVFPSDEWFFYAGRKIPSREWYENFPQFEDGIGTCRLFMDQAQRAYKSLPSKLRKPTRLTLVTGILPREVITEFARRLSDVQNLSVDVCVVINRFFGSGITIAGLMTGQDIADSLKEHGAGDIVAIPDIALKDDAVFLDDLTLQDLRDRTGLDVRVCPSRAKDFIKNWLPKNVEAAAPAVV